MQAGKQLLPKAEAIYFLGKAPNGLGAWACFSSFEPGKPLVMLPELHSVHTQQVERGAQ